MKCNYKRLRLTREEQQDMASIKSTLPLIDRMQIEKRSYCEVYSSDMQEEKSNDLCDDG